MYLSDNVRETKLSATCCTFAVERRLLDKFSSCHDRNPLLIFITDRTVSYPYPSVDLVLIALAIFDGVVVLFDIYAISLETSVGSFDRFSVDSNYKILIDDRKPPRYAFFDVSKGWLPLSL